MKQFELQTAEYEEDDDLVEGRFLMTSRPATLMEATELFQALEQVKKQTFIAQGFILRVVQDDCLYQSAGYVDIYSYARGELGIKDNSTVNRYININKRFSVCGYSQMIEDKYMNYKYSALQEIWGMTDEEIESAGITETTTVAKIREIKKEMREEEPETDEQIPGQTEITDFIPNPIATSQKKSDWQKGIFENDKEGYGWQRSGIVNDFFKQCHKRSISPLSLQGYTLEVNRYMVTKIEEYLVFSGSTDNFKVNAERIKEEYEIFLRQKEKETGTDAEEHKTPASNEKLPEELLMAAGEIVHIIFNDVKDIEDIVYPITEEEIHEEFDNTSIEFTHKGHNIYLETNENPVEFRRLTKYGQPGETIFQTDITNLLNAVNTLTDITCETANSLFEAIQPDKFYDPVEIHPHKFGIYTHAFNTDDNTRIKADFYDTFWKVTDIIKAEVICISDYLILENLLSKMTEDFESDSASEIQENVSNQPENVSNQPESDSKLDSMAAVETTKHLEESEYMTAEMPEGLFKEIALDIVAGITEDNDAETANRILSSESEFIEFIHDIADDDPWQQSYVEGRLFNYSTEKGSIFLDIHELDIDTEHELGIGFGISLDELYELASGIYKKVCQEDIEEETNNKELYQTLEYQAERVYLELDEDQKNFVRNKKRKELIDSMKEMFGKSYQGSGGPGKAYIEFSPKGIVFDHQRDKIRTYKEIADALIKYISYDNDEETKEETVVAEVISTKKDILHLDIDLEKYDINAPKEEKIRTVFKCVNKELANITRNDVKAFNYAIDFIGATNKALVLLDKEKTEKENPKPEESKHEEQHEKESQRQQEPLPELKNNSERRTWLEDYENWPIWIDNKETQERYYRYNFENGDAFVIKVYFSNIPCYNYITRKMEKNPHWGREEYYILEKESDKTYSDSKSTTTAMIDYLKNMQKKG